MSVPGVGTAEFADVSSAALFMARQDFPLWTQDELYQWLSRLRLHSARPWEEVAAELWSQHMDGEAFLLATEDDWRACGSLCEASMAALNACREMFYQLSDSGPADVLQEPRCVPPPPPALEDEVSDMDIDQGCDGDGGVATEFVYGQLIVLGNQVWRFYQSCAAPAHPWAAEVCSGLLRGCAGDEEEVRCRYRS